MGSSCRWQNLLNVRQVKASKTITWGVKADTRLFGLMSIKTGKIEGFEVGNRENVTKTGNKIGQKRFSNRQNQKETGIPTKII